MSSTAASLGKWTLNETKRVAVFHLKVNLCEIGPFPILCSQNRLIETERNRKLALFNSVKKQRKQRKRENSGQKFGARDSEGSQDSEVFGYMAKP